MAKPTNFNFSASLKAEQGTKLMDKLFPYSALDYLADHPGDLREDIETADRVTVLLLGVSALSAAMSKHLESKTLGAVSATTALLAAGAVKESAPKAQALAMINELG